MSIILTEYFEKETIFTCIDCSEEASETLSSTTSKITNHAEKKSLCDVLSKRAKLLRQQLEQTQSTLKKAEEERATVQREIYENVRDAFTCRAKAAKMGVQMKSLGIEVKGAGYKLPLVGTKDLRMNLRAVYSKTMNKEMNVALPQAQAELFSAWKPAEGQQQKQQQNNNNENTRVVGTTGLNAVTTTVTQTVNGSRVMSTAKTRTAVQEVPPPLRLCSIRFFFKLYFDILNIACSVCFVCLFYFVCFAGGMMVMWQWQQCLLLILLRGLGKML
jgi:hypothetical protein